MDFDYSSLLQNRLPRSFFARPTLEVARDLIGQYFVVYQNNSLKVVQITEIEAYIGTDDQASHARFGKTHRNSLMWGQPGVLYIYLIYGLHYLLNIITETPNSPAAVLVRAGRIIKASEVTNFSSAASELNCDGCKRDKISLRAQLNGPAKFTKYLNITKLQNGLDIATSNEIFISKNPANNFSITTAPRIGINYASEPWKSIQWRFILTQTSHSSS